MARKIRIAYWSQQARQLYTGSRALGLLLAKCVHLWKHYGWAGSPPNYLPNLRQQVMWYLTHMPPNKLGGDEVLFVRELKHARKRRSRYRQMMLAYKQFAHIPAAIPRAAPRVAFRNVGIAGVWQRPPVPANQRRIEIGGGFVDIPAAPPLDQLIPVNPREEMENLFEGDAGDEEEF